MNEKIKELAETALKSSMVHDGIYRPEGYANSVSKVFADKFVELIVKECVDKVDKTGCAFNEQPQYTDKQNALVSEGFFWALESVKQQVKEHFGIKE